MSGLAHLPGAPDPVAPNVSHFTQPPGALHIAVPVIQPPWNDITSSSQIPTPSTQTFYVTNPASVIPSLPMREKNLPDAPNPRPRKPYTTTKVREMWSSSEHERMLEGLRRYKRDWAKVTSFVGTRSAAQVRSHAQKYFDRVARDKTDEYVPRARPKRKSATPYPRKVREEAARAQPQQQGAFHASVPTPYQVPVVHPPQSSFEMQPVAFASPHLHQPVHIAPGQSPMLSHMPATSYVAQPQQHAVGGQVAVQHRVYSPYMEMSSAGTPNLHHGNMRHTPDIQASPMSYISGQAYPTHSPSLAQQTISIPTASMYGMLSPVTPGAFSFGSGHPHSVTHTPVTVYGQPGVGTPNMPVAAPRHSHPEGPVKGCAKCKALQRYGAVLQEIGEISNSPKLPEPDTRWARSPHHPTHEGSHPNPTPDRACDATLEREHSRKRTSEGPGDRQPASKFGPDSPPRKDEAGSVEASDCAANIAPANNRAHRSRIMKARKLKQKSTTTKDGRATARSGSEEQSQSANSASESHGRTTLAKDSLLRPNLASTRQGGVSKKRKNISRTNQEMNKKEVVRTQGNSPRKVKRHKIHPGQGLNRDKSEIPNGKQAGIGSDQRKTSPDPQRRPAQSTATNGARLPSPKSDESETGPKSPLPRTYTNKERMELFDAVHSLQILAKTSSSGSQSPSSDEEARRSDEKQ